MREKILGSRDVRYMVAAGVLLPLVAAALLVWGLGNRTGSTDNVPVAVVNNDKPITGKNPTAAGRALTAELTNPSSKPAVSLAWTLTDTDDATAGLRNGTYYSVLTIPKNFSQSVVSTGTDHPVQAKVTLQSNAAANASVGLVSQAVAQAAVTALGTQVTENFVTNTLNGLNQESQSLGKAASNAKSLASGTSSLAKAAGQLDTGSQQLASGTDQLATGAAGLATGSGQVANGADEVASGLDELASKLDSAQQKTTSLSSRTGGAEERARSVANRTQRVATATDRVRTTAGDARARAAEAATEASSVTAELGRLDRLCATVASSTGFCTRLHQVTQRSGRVAGDVRNVASRASSAVSSARAVDREATAAKRAADKLTARTAKLDAAARNAAQGVATTRTSVDQLAAGADSVASGATNVHQGAVQLSAAADQTSSAATQVADGNAQLASNSTQLDQGAQSLSSSLASGAKKAPSYTSDQVKQLSKVAGQPIVMTTSSEHDTVSNAWLIGAVVGLVLWFGALAGMFIRPRAAAAPGRLEPVSSTRLAALRLVPQLALSLAQALVVFVVLLVFRQGVTSSLAFGAFTLLGAVVFALIAAALDAGRHRGGTIAFLLLTALQLAAIGGLIPIQTAPGLLQALNGLLPLTAFVNGATQFASGGSVHSVTALTATLVCWGVVALLIATFRTRRDRRHEGASAVGGPGVTVGEFG